MALKSLEQHNKDMLRLYSQGLEQHGIRNGIECPECKEELVDCSSREVLTSYPPQKRVYCPKCGWTGTRFY
jgi:uncharacterized protein with PIN domain